MIAQRASTRRRGGFTLIESAIAVVVVGVGIVALLQAMASGTRINGQARAITQGVFLAQEVREWTLRLPFKDPNAPNPNMHPYTPGPESGENPQVYVNDLDDLESITFSPPRDGEGQAIPELSGWTQTITMQWRDPGSLTTAVPSGTSGVVHVTVSVSRNNQSVHSASWIVTDR